MDDKNVVFNPQNVEEVSQANTRSEPGEVSFDARNGDIMLKLTAEYLVPLPERDEPEFYVRPICGEILGVVDDDDQSIVLGSLELHYVLAQGTSDITYWADHVSSDLGALACDLFVDGELAPAINAAYNEVMKQDFLTISEITVFPKYRGCGIGKRAVQAVIAACAPCCGLIAVNPSPTESPIINPNDPDRSIHERHQHADDAKRLRRFFEKLGFRLLTDEHMTYCTERERQPSLAGCRRLRLRYLDERTSQPN